MSSVTFVEGLHLEPPRDRHPAALPSGVVLSILFHASIALLLVLAPWARHETPPPQFVMEVVQLPQPPEVKAPEPPPQLQAPPQIALPPPEVPQLTEAPIAEKSAPPPQESKVPTPPRERPAPRAEPKPAAPPVLHAPLTSREANAVPATQDRQERSAESRGGGTPAPASQKVQDFILMQIARLWIIDLHSPRFRDLDIGWAFVLRPDGMLEPPFGKNDPWDLQDMVDPRTYAIMKEPGERGRFYTTVVTTFLQAVRQAQPFRVPQNEESYINRSLPLRFHAGDLVQTTSENSR